MMPNRDVVALHIKGKRARQWQQTLQQQLSGLICQLWEEIDDPARVIYAVVWQPPPGELRRFPALKAIFSIGAGVDHVLRDPHLPAVPLFRTTGSALVQRMSEYVVLHALRHHRRLDSLINQQATGHWSPPVVPPAARVQVGIMGLGALGSGVASMLSAVGFSVLGWSRRPKALPDVTCYAGAQQLNAFLAECHILVCLLPLTDATRAILNAETFAALPRGAFLINAARGEHLVEADLLNALASGQLNGATLDVFCQEPLPPDHPFWHHPRILVTCHSASLVDPEVGSTLIAANVMAFQQGEQAQLAPLQVDLSRGY